MADYEVTAPDGTRYQVTAPDTASQDEVLRYAQSQFAPKAPSVPMSTDAGWEPKPAAAPAAPAAAPAAPMSTTGDVLASAGSGLVRGVTGMAGLPGNVESLMQAGWNKIAPEALKVGPGYSPQLPGEIKPATTQDIERATGIEGQLHEPQTTAGKFARTVAEFAPGMVMGPGGVVRRFVTQSAVPGVASELAGQATEGTKLEPWARAIAAIFAPFAVNAAGHFITPVPATPEAAAAAQTLTQEGVPVSAGQATGSRALRYAEEHLGDMPGAGGAVRRADTATQEGFTRAALRRIGEDAPRATDEVIDRAFNRIGGEFDRLTQGHSIPNDQMLQGDIAAAVNDYNRLTPNWNRAPIVDEIANEIAQNRGAMIPGELYQSERSALGRMERSMGHRDPVLGHALASLRESLDAAMTRSLPAADSAALVTARHQYRNLMAIERAATGSAAGSTGLITPAQLRQAVVTTQGRRSFARGQGDMDDLIRAGNADSMRPLPQSGTGPRNFWNHIMTAIGAGLGAAHGGPTEAMAGAAAGALAPGLAGRALMTRPVQRIIGNQLLTGPMRAANAPAAATANAINSIPEVARELNQHDPATQQAIVDEYRKITGATQ